MSNVEVRKVSLQDLQLVQNLIERCLQLYMSQSEVVSTLLHQAKIEPGFTELVWQKLEAENQEFFRSYYLRLMVKDQILRFNALLERQVELMRQMSQPGVVSTPLCNVPHTPSMHNNSGYRDPLQSAVPSIKPENMHQVISVGHSVCTNSTSSLRQCMQVDEIMAGHAGRITVPANMPLAQSSNAGIVQGFNRGTIKAEGGYARNYPVMFGADIDLVETRNVISESSISPFNGEESSSQAFREVLELETNSYGHFGQITGNFSLSDLTADFSNSTGILESNPRYPFLGTDANFLEPRIIRDEQRH